MVLRLPETQVTLDRHIVKEKSRRDVVRAEGAASPRLLDYTTWSLHDVVVLFPPATSAVGPPRAVVARRATCAAEAGAPTRDEQKHDYRGTRAGGAVGGGDLSVRLARVRAQLQQRVPALEVRLKAVPASRGIRSQK